MATDHVEPIWVLTGPTAAGKTSLALELAEAHGMEIVSMDSMAVYRRMDIGTAKPSTAEQQRVRHHLIDLVDPNEGFDASRFCETAAATIDELRERGVRPLFVGGTPLYLMAFFKGLLEGPAAQPEIRARLEQRERETPGSLYAELETADPAAAERIHPRDTRRLVRALEFLEVTGRPISSQQTSFDDPDWLRPCRIAVVQRERDDLHERVKRRTRQMLEEGLVEETRAIRDDIGFSRQAGAAIGYAQCLDHLKGRFKDEEELRNMIRRATHRLIRRQTTWLRHIREAKWFDPDGGVAALRAALGVE